MEASPSGKASANVGMVMYGTSADESATSVAKKSQRNPEGVLPPAKPFDALKILLQRANGMSETTATWLLVFVVAILGINFGVVKSLSQVFDSPTLLFGRFIVATLCLSPWLFGNGRKVIVSGVESGAWLAAAYIAQAVSLAAGTPASVCSFFASLNCIVCPFFLSLLGVKLNRKAWVAAALAIAGAAVIELGGGAMPTLHDFIALFQALFFGIYLIRTENAVNKNPGKAMAITASQVLCVAMVAAVWGVVGAGGIALVHVGAWFQNMIAHPQATAGLVYMGVLPSAFALTVETIVLSKLSSSKTSLLFATEPLFAAVFAALFLGEAIGLNVAFGGTLALAACLVSSIPGRSVLNYLGALKKAWVGSLGGLEKARTGKSVDVGDAWAPKKA